MTESNVGVTVVLGAGLTGTGIGHALAVAGHQVRFVDTNAAAATRAIETIRGMVEDGVRRSKLTAEQAQRTLDRLSAQPDLEAVLRATRTQLSLEAVSESLTVKREIVSAADRLLCDEAIIATNTSALSVTEIAAVTRRPDRVVGRYGRTVGRGVYEYENGQRVAGSGLEAS
jgi:3-hydroxybutyryl-CoA dehydrogenase